MVDLTKDHSVVVIGSGFAGLASACVLAQAGVRVILFEKNDRPGGRARHFTANGFMFDMGPSWYWMPEVFDAFFARFNKKTSDYYQLQRLDPSYRVFFENPHQMDIPASLDQLKEKLESIESGAANALDRFLDEARIKYNTGMHEFVWKPSLSIREFMELRLVREAFRMQLFTDMSSHLRRFFKHEKILKLLEFPVLFLGAKPQKTPALYSMMNYADIALGTWYPQGGMQKIIEAMVALAKELGVEIHLNAPVEEIWVENGEARGVVVNGSRHSADAIIGAADYHHIESKLLNAAHRSYSDEYWKKKIMAPSCLLFYLGVNKKVKGLLHHNLFFDRDFDRHAEKIYDSPSWTDEPLFYACVPSVTDASVAPEGMENIFILIPSAPGLASDEAMRERMFDIVMKRLEERTGESIRNHIIYKRSFGHEEFIVDYNAFRGNAYGLANTLMQTAFLKPRMKSKKVNKLFFAGQLTVPGPGVPPSLISGQVAAAEVLKELQTIPKKAVSS
jgi:phytoene desaturase